MAGSVQSRLKVTRRQVLAGRRARGAPTGRLGVAAAGGLVRPAGQHAESRAAPVARPGRRGRALDVGASSLAQLWGPRYSTYVVPKRDFALFSLGRFPDDAKGRLRAERTAERLTAQLDGRRMTDRQAARALHLAPVRRDDGHGRDPLGGARAPTVWTVAVERGDARSLGDHIVPATAPGRPRARPAASAARAWPVRSRRRGLPRRRAELRAARRCESRGGRALLLDGANAAVEGDPRRNGTPRTRLSRGTRDAIEAEARGLPLPGRRPSDRGGLGCLGRPRPSRPTPSRRSTSRRGRRSPRWWSATTASSAAVGAWGSTPKGSARRPPRPSTASGSSSASGQERLMRRSSSTGTTASAGASSAHPTSCPGSRAALRTRRSRTSSPDWRIACNFVGKGHRRQGVASAGLAGALELIAGLGGGTVEGYPEDAASVPAGFLFNGALSTYERLGFARDRKIGKHRWVVIKVVKPRR